MKVLATIHPSYCTRQHSALSHLRDDFEKASREAWFPEVKRVAVRYITQPTVPQAREFLRLGDTRPLVLDIETRGFDGGVLCVGVARELYNVCVLPWREPFVGMLRSALLDASSPKVAHNGFFDFRVLQKTLGIRINGEWRDTIVQHSMLYPDLRHRLAVLGQDWYDGGPWKDDEGDSLETYCAKDVDVTGRALVGMTAQAEGAGVAKRFHEVMRVLPSLVAAKQHGVGIDLERQAQVREQLLEVATAAQAKVFAAVAGGARGSKAEALLAEADALEQEALVLWKPGTKREAGKLKTQAKRARAAAALMVGPELNSPKQLATLLYEHLGLPEQRDHDTKKITTNDDAIVELLRRCADPKFAHALPVLEGIREWREVAVLLGTFLSHIDSVVYPDWNMHGTATGRLSCNDPNVMNVPNRGQYAKAVRSVYVPVKRGNMLTRFDYSQLELRVQAWASREPLLMEAFARGEDVHTKIAAMSLSLAYGRVVAPEEVTHAQRYVHKRAVFLESYGGAWLKLQTKLAAEGVVLGVAEVKQLLRTLAEARPTLMRWRERVLEAAERDRCLRNPFGRLRWFLGPAFGDALNFIPQSTAADIILDAMVLVYERLPKGAIMVAQVHDELIVEHPPALVKEVRAVMQESMEAPVAVMDGWQFPVEGKSGRDWTFAEG